jgi:predicted ATP-dependent serine protease
MAYYECKKCGYRENYRKGFKPGICPRCGGIDTFVKRRGAINYAKDTPQHDMAAMTDLTEDGISCCLGVIAIVIIIAIIYFALGFFGIKLF